MTRPRRSRGIALIMALLVLTLLVVIVGQLAYSTRIDLQVTRNASDSQAALMAAWGGVEFSKGLLRDDVQHNEHDGPADRWARLRQPIKVGEVPVRITIEDEDRKLNLLLLRSQHEAYVEFATGVLERVIAEAREGVEDRSELPAAELAEALIEWIREGKTPGTAQEQAAAEREDGEAIPPLTLSEFLVVKGWSDRVLFGPPPAPRAVRDEDDPYGALAGPGSLGAPDAGADPERDALDALYGDTAREPRAVADFITLWSTGRININTVEPMLLASLSENMSEEVVRAIIAKRNSGSTDEAEEEADPEPGTAGGGVPDNSFREVRELREVEGMEGGGEGGSLINELEHYLTVQSQTFKVTAAADVGRVRRTVEVILRRQKSGFRVLWYKER